MVSRAVERAQNTVEAKNAEARKELLKYDEVRNEQRRVIYARRRQILDGDDLHDQTQELIAARMEEVVDLFCPSDYAEEWDIEKLHLEITNHFPTTLTIDELGGFSRRDELVDAVVEEAIKFYEEKCESFEGGLDWARNVEREVMLSLLDQRWQEHMSELDHLMDGIHLRATAQVDPLVAWQREGYSMFENLLHAVDSDYARYVLNIQQVVPQQATADLTAASTNVDSVEESADGTIADVSRANRAKHGTPGAKGAPRAAIVKDSTKPGQKIGRNEPCYCGSGRKYKLCHGRP
jgi:preprotein translocase subunit SecA